LTIDCRHLDQRAIRRKSATTRRSRWSSNLNGKGVPLRGWMSGIRQAIWCLNCLDPARSHLLFASRSRLRTCRLGWRRFTVQWQVSELLHWNRGYMCRFNEQHDCWESRPSSAESGRGRKHYIGLSCFGKCL